MKKFVVIRNANIGDLLETLLVSSVASILVIRFFLKITSYPQLGNGSFHIAHMLWGGFFMLTAIVLLLSFLGTHVRQIAAVLGGIGFGTFIDELGKFITSDNNYFFQPTVAILYVLFLMLFFIFRYIERHSELSEKEYLMNALELLGEGVQNDMDQEEKETFLHFLTNENISRAQYPFTKHLIALSKDIDLVEPTEPSTIEKFFRNIIHQTQAFIRSRFMRRIILIFFIFNASLALLSILIILVTVGTGSAYTIDFPKEHVWAAVGEVIATIFSAIFMIVGVSILKFSRYRAYLFFKYSVLISILITQFFIFYREQLSAVFGLFFNAFVLLVLNYMISLERAKRIDKGGENI